jgi:intracellular septation protein
MNFIREIGPLVIFFATYKFYSLMEATLVLAAIMSLLLAYDYFIVKKVQMQMLVSTILLLVFGSISFFTGNMTFIKMKVTIINLLFGLTLLIGVHFNKAFAQYILGAAINLSHKNWIILSKRFAIYFLFLAAANEIVWRNFSEEFWVNFKIFGATTISFIFICTQIYFLMQNQIHESEGK